ncbi:MAG: signal peptidase I ['Candidatus Kapabacteria' thiocyanatum]|uniref:Signal peptidase I n=1 Tax=Candidatus Kapaibacterium thiocyanatum TaxID=1895771 RepID=A0A1M3KWM8_9BACT|nr:signal peptidase I ['Candidatus Kapabacteria' thiocyanatum]OJX56808.1 MAG: signal peptidase I ['Candidatus Kapabacteria' thiocyanatum]
MISLRDVLWTALAATATALLLKIFVIGAFMIPSHSMERTLLAGDYIVVSKLAYTIGSVERGDVIVFRGPDTTGPDDDRPLIKRVVAVGGDSLVLTPNEIFVNDMRLPTPPLSAAPGPVSIADSGILRLRIPEGRLFVIGDNRANSYDSRYWGLLDSTRIIGKPLFVYWSYGPSTDDTAKHVRWGRLFSMIR